MNWLEEGSLVVDDGPFAAERLWSLRLPVLEIHHGSRVRRIGPEMVRPQKVESPTS